MKPISIAIDGPAGAGKSTVAKIVAAQLSLLYLDTGAMYRTLTYKALRDGVDVHDEAALNQLLQQSQIELKTGETQQAVFLDNEDVSEWIRTPVVNQNVSQVSAHRLIREDMVRRQQALGKTGGIVMDGRDIGTHVMPDAELKIFLVASVEERARRRHEENLANGQASDLQELQQAIADRDAYDSTRAVAPLRKADDAIELDTTKMTISEVVAEIIHLTNSLSPSKK